MSIDLRDLKPITERRAVDADTFAREIVTASRPVVLRGQVADWPAVGAAKQGARAIAEYLAGFGGGRPLDVMIGPPEIGGRFFYADDSVTGLNFHRQSVALGALLGELLRFAEEGVARPHALYANSATAPEHLPGWEAANPLGLAIDAPARLWIGNATQVATHYDMSSNIACVVAGRRRFTLFPPDQLANLYVGPLDHTLAGQPVSMVDPEAPDVDRYPRFTDALTHAETAELGPGDAIFIPPLWWHHVRAFDPLNVLVNYWWGHESGAAFPALIHAVLAIRDLPPAEKATWRAWFDHMVFAQDADRAADHLPPAARSVLGPSSPARTHRLRDFLVRMLQRS
ncbi:MAG: cupin-like domain-containing protein [Sphingomonas sp.]|uniref:cupin-like domain-containing protein n=1 Tax=Sphingomonas sp. TaxID=28214 RepID=UPI001ACD8751|nr:cupin-like domain-containing protein [Sphingomonas sp.]MBN8807847.1 cupin-like domain-containing protein [Sphingomonas sp.]